jgi:hypothetical protein
VSIDRRRLVADLLPHLRSTGHLVELAGRPDGGGGDPDGAYVPYVTLWPQPTVYLPQLSGAHAGDTTVTQLTCVANDPDRAMRVAADMTALMLAPPATLAGRPVVQVRIELSRGPERDPRDERLFFCQVLPAVQTHA